MTTRPTKRDWTPVLKNGIYCSPACGGRERTCTKAMYDTAVKKAKALAKRMGPGWEIEVWENLGWHYKVTRGLLEVHDFKHGNYWIALQTVPQFYLNHKNPVIGAKLVIKKVRDHINYLKKELDKLD